MDDGENDGAAVKIPPPLVYLAGVIVGAVCGASVLGAALSARLKVTDQARRVLTGCVAVCAVLSLGTATYQRNFAYGSELEIWQDVVSKHPENHRGHFNLGRMFLDAGRLDEAAQSLERAIPKAVGPRFEPDFRVERARFRGPCSR